MKIASALFCLFITGSILVNPDLSLHYALMGLRLWFEKMIPSLLPFMILSGIMVRMKLTEPFTYILYPFVNPIYKVSRNACYCMFLGFLCGFPMGARTIADLYKKEMLSKREANYLLAFCNNIGPVYFCSFALPMLGRKMVWPYLAAMYGIPLIYGLFLRYTFYRDLNNISPKPNDGSCKMDFVLTTDDAVQASLQNMLSLGGYMILFQMLNLIPHILFPKNKPVPALFFEISGGILSTKEAINRITTHHNHIFPGEEKLLVLFAMLGLSFGGLCCLMQTASSLRGTSLDLKQYTLHKCIITFLTGIYYLIWYLVCTNSFLL